MAEKLTLSISSEVSSFAKDYAKKKGISVSLLVENYFKSLVTRNGRKSTGTLNRKVEITPRVKRLGGVLKNDEKTYKELRTEQMEHLYKKHSQHTGKK
ncbi:MAG: DUF6364 family protein [Flavobacteriales bacterium]|mgnify:CR=1 FL=1|nr:DUF6364 family protein [Flavobacteriales bacterium]